MKCLAAITVAALFVISPAVAQSTSPGKSDTAPGQTGKTPGQMQQNNAGKTGKDYAPGRKQDEPGDAKNINPGSKQRH
jgi:hypothetical protein